MTAHTPLPQPLVESIRKALTRNALPGEVHGLTRDTEREAAEFLAQIAAEREALRKSAPEADILIEEIAAYPQLATPADHPAIAAVAALAAAPAKPRTVSFGTEAGLYAETGIPTVICGPGDMTRAHRADEWIGLDELTATERMLERLAGKLRHPAAAWMTT